MLWRGPAGSSGSPRRSRPPRRSGRAISQTRSTRASSANAYIKAVAAGSGSASQAVAAAIVLASRGADKRALRTLQRARGHFTEADDLALIDQLIARLSDAASDAGAPDAQISRHRAAITALLKPHRGR